MAVGSIPDGGQWAERAEWSARHHPSNGKDEVR